MDEVLSILLKDNACFPSSENARRLAIAIGGDHGKDAFTMLLAMHAEMSDGTKRHMDEGIGKIENDQDNAENLKHLGHKLRGSFLNYNVSFCRNTLVRIGAHETTLERNPSMAIDFMCFSGARTR